MSPFTGRTILLKNRCSSLPITVGGIMFWRCAFCLIGGDTFTVRGRCFISVMGGPLVSMSVGFMSFFVMGFMQFMLGRFAVFSRGGGTGTCSVTRRRPIRPPIGRSAHPHSSPVFWSYIVAARLRAAVEALPCRSV